MKFVAGSCIYCERWNATQQHQGDLVCEEHEDEDSLCFAMWEARLPDMFGNIASTVHQIYNYGK